MIIEDINPARTFPVGYENIILRHVANIELEADEMVTFVAGESEYDVCRKNWGYYATPSLDKRLPGFGLRPALMRNKLTRHYFVVLVQESQLQEWKNYMIREEQELVVWLDDAVALEGLSIDRGLSSE